MKNKFIFFFLLLCFLYLPNNVFAETRCSALSDDWNVISSSTGEGCKGFAVPYNSHVRHIVFQFDSPKLRHQNDYSLNFDWYVTSVNPVFFLGEFIQTYNEQHFYDTTTRLVNTEASGSSMYKRNFNSVVNFTSLSDENTYSIVYNIQDLTQIAYIGYSSFNMELVGDNATENAIINSASEITSQIEESSQQVIINNNENTEKIIESNEELKESLLDDDMSDLDSSSSGGGAGKYFGEIESASNTPITDLIMFPVNLINKIYDGLDSECNSYTIPFDFTGGNNTLTFPCIDLGSNKYFGESLWNTIDFLIIGFMIYQIGMLVISFYESWSSLADTFDNLYTPRHSSDNYIGRHEK